jgi:hypothetical protein
MIENHQCKHVFSSHNISSLPCYFNCTCCGEELIYICLWRNLVENNSLIECLNIIERKLIENISKSHYWIFTNDDNRHDQASCIKCDIKGYAITNTRNKEKFVICMGKLTCKEEQIRNLLK